MALWKNYLVLYGGFHDIGVRSESLFGPTRGGTLMLPLFYSQLPVGPMAV